MGGRPVATIVGATMLFALAGTPLTLGSGPAPDIEAPKLDLAGKKEQKLDDEVEVYMNCSEDCTAAAEGFLKIKGGIDLKPDSRFAPAGRTVVLDLTYSKNAREAAIKALEDKKEVAARLTITGTDASGNVGERFRNVELRLPKSLQR